MAWRPAPSAQLRKGPAAGSSETTPMATTTAGSSNSRAAVSSSSRHHLIAQRVPKVVVAARVQATVGTGLQETPGWLKRIRSSSTSASEN